MRYQNMVTSEDPFIYVGDVDQSAILNISTELIVRAEGIAKLMKLISKKAIQEYPIGLETLLLSKYSSYMKFEQYESDCQKESSWPRLDNIHSSVRPYILKARPSELGVISLYNNIEKGGWNIDTLLKSSKVINGISEIRSVRIATSKFISGERIEFVYPELVVERLQNLFDIIKIKRFPPVIDAIFVYFLVTVIHPLIDGNGRLARAIFQAIIKERLDIPYPLFPLGPSFEINKRQLIHSKFFWYFQNNASYLVDFIIRSLENTCLLIKSNITIL